jgi:menaquinone-dependent protoporphyrinogen IX oxidase
MLRTLIVYESKYETTQRVASYLSLVLGPARYCTTNQFQDEYKDFDFIVVGSPIYSGKSLPKISKFLDDNADWLKNKKVALFSTSISPQDGYEKLVEMETFIGEAVSKRALGGTLKMERLDPDDLEALEMFSERVGFPLMDMDHFNLEEVIEYALELKNIRDDMIPTMPPAELIKAVESFLKSHNTCTLSTSYQERVRSTPIEYTYHQGNLYLISEGGEKFANLLLNSQVSVAVYEHYTTMNNLAGMQISGEASLVENKDEYQDIISRKGLNPDMIRNLPFYMNIIKIKIKKIEFLYSEFAKEGYGPKQILKFPN